VAALSMAGLPPFFGFLGKEMLYEAVLPSGLILAAGVVPIVTSYINIAMSPVLNARLQEPLRMAVPIRAKKW